MNQHTFLRVLVVTSLSVSLAACGSSGGTSNDGAAGGGGHGGMGGSGGGAAGHDAATDASDAPSDVADAKGDAGPDGGVDGPVAEAGGDTGSDVPSEAGTDAAGDGGADATTGDGGDASAVAKVTIRFKAMVGATAFACGQTYTGLGSTAVAARPHDLRFYVEGLRLVDAQDKEVPLVLEDRWPWQTPDVALLDFEDGSGECVDGNSAMNAVVTGTVPAGTYKGIVFSNGVPEKLNHADPLKLPAPLQVGAMTWGWLYGFKFVKVEMAATAAPVGDAGAGFGLVHLGSTGCNNSVDGGEPDFGAAPTTTCTNQNRNEVRLTGFDPTAKAIVLDVAAIFAKTDVSKESFCHSVGDACPSLFEAFGVNYATGAKLATQTVYRPE
jgi:uncharacterized repeat protein (TIGR04052 family)